jgi:hypothetical protein
MNADTTMKTFVATVVMAAMLAAPAFAQKGISNPTPGNPHDKVIEAQAEKDRAAAEKEYDETMKRLPSPGGGGKSDPWARMRPAGEAKR